MSAKKPHRRTFLQASAAAAGAMTLPASSYAKVAGANGNLNVALVPGFNGAEGADSSMRADVLAR